MVIVRKIALLEKATKNQILARSPSILISPSSQRAKDLWYKFNLKWDVVGSPDHQWTAGKTTVLEPWMVMTYTASLMKDPDSKYRAVNHLNWFDTTYGTSHQVPSFNAEAGWSLRARAELLKP